MVEENFIDCFYVVNIINKNVIEKEQSNGTELVIHTLSDMQTVLRLAFKNTCEITITPIF